MKFWHQSNFNALFFLGLSLIGINVLEGQSLSRKQDELKNNVVYIEASSKEDGLSTKLGYGFLIGALNKEFYIVTALHNVDFQSEQVSDVEIKIKIHQTPGFFKAKLLEKFGTDDLALLSIDSTKYLNWNKRVMASDLESDSIVSFVIWDSDNTLNRIDGQLGSIKGDKMFFNHDQVKTGVSGSPLINKDGIIGIVLHDDSKKKESGGLSISAIKRIIGLPFPKYFQLEPSPESFINLPTKKIVNSTDKKAPSFSKRDQYGMVNIPSGVFQMGDGYSSNLNAKHEHEVKVKSFYVMPHEVSFEEYLVYCNYKGIKSPNSQKWGEGKHPVINVSWYDAIDYCNWKSVQENLEPCYPIGKNGIVIFDASKNGFRLPTEAEWEYVARDGGKKNVIFGNAKSELSKDINCKLLGKKQTIEVDKGDPNSFGLYNLSGNVAEWCWDYYDFEYYKVSSKENPVGPESGKFRVIRGGSWASEEKQIRVYARDYILGNAGYPTVGFRLARNGE